MSNSSTAAPESRVLLHQVGSGIFSTHSSKWEGYPIGSVIPYSTDQRGRPVVLISTIAEHTKNIKNNPKVALTVQESPSGNVQAKGRISILGEMHSLAPDAEECRQRYYRYFPTSKDYHEAHDFHFYYLSPLTVRYIGGFGKIHWVEGSDFELENPFFGAEERRIVDHMNEDHRHNLRSYCRHYKKVSLSEGQELSMLGLDSEGFDVMAGEQRLRFSFPHRITTAQEARQMMVDMAKAAK